MDRLLIVLPLAIAVGSACSSETSTPEPTDGFDRNALLADVVEEVIEPSVAAFAATARPLAEAIEADRASPSPSTLAVAQDRWRAAMRAWQRVEVLQIGPTAGRARAGGEGLRDELYFWPTVNLCRIDQVLVDRGFEAPGFPAGQLAFVYGLSALEYLLFADPNAQACAEGSAAAAAFAALDAAERRARRAAYAAVLGRDIEQKANRLAAAWSPGPDGFGRKLAGAGRPGSPYRSAQQALDELFAALFYVELVTKDVKLARPAGIALGCRTESCPELLETPHASFAREALEANLDVFESAFRGGTSPGAVGFDDLLAHVGASDLSDRMLAASAEAKRVLASFEQPLRDALVADRARVVGLHGAVKGLTDLLKSQFVSVLALEVPDEGAGDND